MARCALQDGSKRRPKARASVLPIEGGTVRKRITKEHIHIIRQLIGESTNLNQLAAARQHLRILCRCRKMRGWRSVLTNS